MKKFLLKKLRLVLLILNRKIARQYIDQELNEARENIFKNEEETLTWRIDQANKLLNKAISGINDNNHDERNRLMMI